MKFASAFDLHGVTKDERATFSSARELPSQEGTLGRFPPQHHGSSAAAVTITSVQNTVNK